LRLLMSDEPPHTRGLSAVEESRGRRGRLPAIPGRVLAWIFTILVAGAIFYWKKSQSEIESQKAALFARQRGVLAELGPRIEPLKRRIEQWTLASAGPYEGDLAAPELKGFNFAALPGVYLRLRLADATTVESIRKASVGSLRDGFTACLFREPNAAPGSGPPCKASHDCAAGTFCNETDHCMPPAQPYNMRTAYHGTRVLGDEWSLQLRTASDDMRMRLLEREFESAIKDDIPLVIDVLTRAQFFLVVIDEEPPGFAPPPGRAIEALQALPHAARVALFNLKSGKDQPLLRIRREMNARFVPAGDTSPSDPDVVDAQQRQVNSCQLALEVRAFDLANALSGARPSPDRLLP
jgi:hypothetical protein